MSLTKDAIRSKRRRLEAKRNGYCVRCFNEKAVKGRLSCAGCLEKQSNWNKSKAGKASRKKYLLTPKGKAKIARENQRAKPTHAAYMRAWRKRQ